ncbi:MAG: hypothetical protein OJF51_003977 [Nitrospira sp.]|jgi:hypothetical protein|nr:MAG: hypothetical protein OJF51_003977 [Nitrospira sp.]
MGDSCNTTRQSLPFAVSVSISRSHRKLERASNFLIWYRLIHPYLVLARVWSLREQPIGKHLRGALLALVPPVTLVLSLRNPL